ncbi:CvfB family protein [Lutimonas vermicola]|uniref:S1-like domain-containing RNA-binding protein n=1 Tax=Lutimonas vermicola TaxID=414288 RepID=A0ABU9L1K7_9FLAO
MENGKINKLDIVRKDQKGFYLQDKKGKEIFLSKEEIGKDLETGTSIDVFVYKDRSQKISTRMPFAQVDEFAFLKVKFLTDQGAYVDWGLEKELFVPLEEQMEELKEDSSYLFFVFEDEDTGAIRGSQRVEDFVFADEIDVKRGDEVDLLLYRESNLGINAVVNNLYQGLIFKSDIHKEVKVGDQVKGYIKQVREDGKIDLLLEPLGYKKSVESNTDVLLKAIKKAGEFLPLTDKSTPEEVKKSIGLSKKAFKRAAGHLYKKKLIEIRNDGLYLVKNT